MGGSAKVGEEGEKGGRILQRFREGEYCSDLEGVTEQGGVDG